MPGFEGTRRRTPWPRSTGKIAYAGIAQDTIAMGGQRPDHRRRDAARGPGVLGRRRLGLVRPTASARPSLVRRLEAAPAYHCGIAWGGGETPALAGIVASRAGSTSRRSCTGIVKPEGAAARSATGSAPATVIVMLAVERHSRQWPQPGAPACRSAAARLSTPIGSGIGAASFGEALLAPTVLYSPITEALHRAGVRVHYAVNVTGHGWRKLMRHRADLTYRIDVLPDVRRCCRSSRPRPALTRAALTARSTWVQALPSSLPRPDAERAAAGSRVAQAVEAWVAGRVESGPKRLIIEPLDLEYAGSELGVRV
jgi:phosphoribosylformylglycinamidine cyclo-ligase